MSKIFGIFLSKTKNPMRVLDRYTIRIFPIITFVFGFRFLGRYHVIIRSLTYLFDSELKCSEHKNILAPKEHLRPTGMMFVRTSRWKILFTPYLMVELSPSAKIWCVYVTSITDGTRILTFLGIHNNRDFLNSRFFYGDLIILNPQLH